MPAPLTAGDRAPGFALPNQNGQDVALADFAGSQNVLLVFYPFAFSGICAGELSEIRDDLGRFESDDVQVLCISCDPVYSQRAWADAQGYFFPLLSDFWPHGAVSTAYGIFDADRGMAIRGTFLIDRDGVVRWTLINGPGQRRDFAGYHEALAEASATAVKS
ncbi:MAG TPA: peroxiredoxin [Tetrasphaera sp.]|uniref:peroxiredoxin n=1 Tax=Nostocoides sp. TaxID=1917966 RepID=UPI002BC1B16E|nr:peroxiredoxin [Tetrasphaera sp.]HNQ08175.1 peroxiredoxin [Tetrasphaera sp.]